MYRACIFCSAPLGANESIEHFPVGRSLAFDDAMGRLWAVCPRCARWNLAPIEERWEAIEQAERLFRDTPARAHSDNIGIAKLRDGTRLVRIGAALPGELAVWRYGEQMERRGRRALWLGAGVIAAGAGVAVAGFAVASVSIMGAWNLYLGSQIVAQRLRRTVPVTSVTTELPGVATRVRLNREHLAGAWISAPDDGRGIALNLPLSVEAPTADGRDTRKLPLVLRGGDAKSAMARAMVHVNGLGTSMAGVRAAVSAVQRAGSADEYLYQVGRRRLLLNGGDPRAEKVRVSAFDWSEVAPPDSATSLAVEMALHEDTERRAMEGELSALEAMWRQAEEIAAIADALPGLPAEEPPRLLRPG